MRVLGEEHGGTGFCLALQPVADGPYDATRLFAAEQAARGIHEALLHVDDENRFHGQAVRSALLRLGGLQLRFGR